MTARFGWATPERSIGRVHSWHGNALALARACSYILANGGDGLRRVAEAAVLNANWLRHRLRGTYDIPYDRPNMHEFVASATRPEEAPTASRPSTWPSGCWRRASTRPTVYFPLIVEEALMIEPTETESPQTLEALADALIASPAATARGRAAARRRAPRRSAGSTRPAPPAP